LVNGDFLSVGYRRIVGEIDWDILVSATSARGLSQWSMTFGGPAPDRGVAVIEARDGSLLVTGSVNNGAAHGNDVALIKLRRTR
jgi:hypothetical protein